MVARSWFVVSGGFRWRPAQGGQIVAGPFATSGAAARERRALAARTPGAALYVEQEPIAASTDANTAPPLIEESR